MELYLKRIERLNPQLNAFVSVRAEEALAEADAALVRLRAGEAGSLLGVPVAVKDNVDIAGEVTAHGTDAARSKAPADAEVVRRLRAAGAPMLGKTALPELAMWGHFTESQTFGVTRNPWHTGRSTGGSSGGSAAAVAAGLAPVALGSDGGASIRVPSATCGLFGLKPQRGRISTMPDPQHWHGLTVLGGLARSVLDAALFDDVLRGAAPGDAYTPPEPEVSFAEAARREPRPLRIGVSLSRPIPNCSRSSCRATSAGWPMMQPSSTILCGWKLARAAWSPWAGACMAAHCSAQYAARPPSVLVSTPSSAPRRPAHTRHRRSGGTR